MSQGRYDDALCVLRDVLALGPPDARAHLAAAICLAELGSRELAAFEVETALALDSSLSGEIDDDVRLSG